MKILLLALFSMTTLASTKTILSCQNKSLIIQESIDDNIVSYSLRITDVVTLNAFIKSEAIEPDMINFENEFNIDVKKNLIGQFEASFSKRRSLNLEKRGSEVEVEIFFENTTIISSQFSDCY